MRTRGKGLRGAAGQIVLLLIVSSFLYLTRPLFHDMLIGVYKTPSIIIFAILITYIFRHLSKTSARLYTLKALTILLVLTVVYLVGILYVESVVKPIYLSNHLDWQEIDSLPIVKSEHLRITPELVADYYSMAALPYPEYQMGGTDLVYVNGKLIWSAPIIPDGLVNMFRLDDRGMMLVDATTIDKKITEVDQRFLVGEGVLLTKAIWWQVWTKDYWIDLGDWYFLPLNGSAVIVVPAIAYDFKLWAIWPYTIPVFKGVHVIDPGGKVKFYSKKQIEAREIPDYLAVNPLFPKELARYYAETFSWQRGLINILFYHEDHIAVRDPLPQRQPFLILTEQGFYWLIAAEPWGEAQGINRIFLFDASTGEIQMRVLDRPLLGPIRALGVLEAEYPIKAFRRYPLEPLPIISDAKLYWRIVVTPIELTSIAYLALIDSETNEIYKFEHDEHFFAFIERKPIAPVQEISQIERIEQELGTLKKEIREWLAKIEHLEALVANLTK